MEGMGCSHMSNDNLQLKFYVQHDTHFPLFFLSRYFAWDLEVTFK